MSPLSLSLPRALPVAAIALLACAPTTPRGEGEGEGEGESGADGGVAGEGEGEGAPPPALDAGPPVQVDAGVRRCRDELCRGTRSCADGELTTRAPVCDVEETCGLAAPERAVCRTTLAFCTEPLEYTRFDPACANATACAATGRPRAERCTAPPSSCQGDLLVQRIADCDDAEGCRVEERALDCGAQNSAQCIGPRTLATRTCRCTPSGCDCDTRTRECPSSCAGGLCL